MTIHVVWYFIAALAVFTTLWLDEIDHRGGGSHLPPKGISETLFIALLWPLTLSFVAFLMFISWTDERCPR